MREDETPEGALEDLLNVYGEKLVREARLRARARGREDSIVAGDEAVGRALVTLRNRLNPTSVNMDVLLERFRQLIWEEL